MLADLVVVPIGAVLAGVNGFGEGVVRDDDDLLVVTQATSLGKFF